MQQTLHTAHAFSHHGYLNVSPVDTRNNTPEISASSVYIDRVHLAGMRFIKVTTTANRVRMYYSI